MEERGRQGDREGRKTILPSVLQYNRRNKRYAHEKLINNTRKRVQWVACMHNVRSELQKGEITAGQRVKKFQRSGHSRLDTRLNRIKIGHQFELLLKSTRDLVTYKQQKFISQFWSWTSEIRIPVWSEGSGASSLLGCIPPTCQYMFTWQEEGKRDPWCPFQQAANPIDGGSTLMTSSPVKGPIS